MCLDERVDRPLIASTSPPIDVDRALPDFKAAAEACYQREAHARPARRPRNTSSGLGIAVIEPPGRPY